ncbi:HD domain-containing protein [Candidatus Contubernalis alkaliaceticus]|uniref:HD domain-containing protein n=1 Tax=Candidatus Contubernalis alkaliaceticus TaxID=338645 RepID=UPI001F4C017F|nr:HD domain-containing protein [Candidatus Contubernalis alkalaceticus]UNC91906.1 CCA tRNA nucleotidyltransferase [Candidatus Contubernalis alkalaceticus]
MEKKILEIINNLAEQARLKVYITGGYIRALLLNHSVEVIDIDFLVTGGPVEPFVEKAAKSLQSSLVELDKNFGIYRVVIKQEKKNYKILDFTSLKGRNLVEDLKRRDFTVNSLALHLGDYLQKSSSWQHCLIDINGGLEDLKEKKIRMVSPKAFQEDPSRLIRGIRLCASLGFNLDGQTQYKMLHSRKLLKEVSGERIRDELWKIFDLDVSYPWVKFMEETLGFLSVLFPEVSLMKTTEQNFFHGEEVWSHCLHTFKSIEQNIVSPPFSSELAMLINQHMKQELVFPRKRKQLLKFFALFHDVGKIKTKKVLDSGRIVFHRHEVEGIPILENYSGVLKLSSKERRILSSLTRNHMHPLFLQVAKNVSPRAFYKLFNKCGEETVEVLMHSLSDFIAKREAKGNFQEIKFYQEFIHETFEKYFFKREIFVSPPDIISGEEIMEYLKLHPSPGVGYLLAKVKEAQSDGKVKNRREALNLASQIVKTDTYRKRFHLGKGR